MKVLAINDNSGPKYHRILLPCFLMNGIELTVDSVLTEENSKVDIIFYNRMFTKTTIQNVLDLREKNEFKMIVDFDDSWILGNDHILYDMYKEFRASEIMEEFIKLSDAVTVTHDRLREIILPINKNVHILPNAIPKYDQFLYPKTPSDTVRLFWAGGVTHRKDLEILRNPVKRIKDCEFVLGGFVKDHPEWQSMASAFTNGGRVKHRVLEAMPVADYYSAYSECDIALIPLKYSRFNTYKSNLKILEAANISAPCIVSEVDPYLGFPYVNYVKNQSDWYKHATNLIRNKALREDQGAKLKEHCDQVYNFAKINEERRQVFEAVKQG